MRRNWLKVTIPLALLGLLAYAWLHGGRRTAEAPSLLPEARDRLAGLRFDPSYFYGRGVTARELASELVPRWRDAGLNAIFFRAYDPAHGASYRTSLPYSREADYGRQDLLRWVLEEARGRGMKVYAWLTPLNHAGAWEARKEWRVLRRDGEPYRTESLPAPLCPRQPGVREWWLRFVGDLLDRYPELDGVDLAEPVLSWRETEACYCELCSSEFRKEPPGRWSEFRAGPLTDLVLETFRLARERGKETVLTTVLPADRAGNPLPFAALREETGLDLERLLASPGRPQRLSVELLWQEWAAVHKNREVFSPGWAGKAVAEVRRRVAGRAAVSAHLELTDFDPVSVRPEDLAASLAAALEAGAEGFEAYDAALFEKKAAWGALREAATVFPRKKVLVLHHPEGESDGRQLEALCGHFAAEVEVKPIASYAAGDLKIHDALFYIGTSDGTAPGETFLEEVAAAEKPILWLGANLQHLLQRAPRCALAYESTSTDPAYDTVLYRGADLIRKDPNLNLIRVTDPAKVQVLAEARSPQASAPYALRSGTLWCFADNPLSYAVEGGTYIVLADLLHEILEEDHAGKKLALVRLEDVHPLTPPEDLLAAARLLHGRGIPFLVALVPIYTFPEKGEYASLDDQPEFVAALKEAVRLGGTIVLHGVTHQRGGESTADYEFWDPAGSGPPADRTDAKTQARISLGLEECRRHGIYPLLWETPHYAATLADYKVISRIFSGAVERRQADNRLGTDQLYPYVIRKDRFGQLLLPENLGYVPLENQSAAPILAAAKRTGVARDAVAGFFFHLFCDQAVLKEIVDGLKEQGFSFPDVRSLALSVAGPDFQWCTASAPFPANPPGNEARLLEAGGEEVWRGPAGAFPREEEAPLGIRLFLPADSGGVAASAAPRWRGQENLLSKPLQAGILASKEEGDFIAAAFRSIAAPCRLLDPEVEIAAVPADLTLLAVSETAGQSISPALCASLRGFLGDGGVLLHWGKTALAEELGVQFGGGEREVAEVTDRGFDRTVRLREPRPVAVPAFPASAEILAEGKEEEVPLLAVLPVGDGKLFYSALPPFDPGGGGPYPYLFNALQDHGLLSPVCRAKRLEVYFDWSQREEVAVEDLVKLWARHGVRAIHAAAWHEYPEWTYDYGRLLELAHQNAMLVYAWLALPLVSEKFWGDHPEWREKNPRGEDVKVGWRQAVSLVDPACREAVKRWIAAFLARFDFDGVTLAGLSFGGEAIDRPETLSPFSEAARKDFREQHGFDPRELWEEGGPRFWKGAPEDLEAFLAWRKLWTTRLHREFLDFLTKLPAPGQTGASPRALVVSLPDAAADPAAADLAGVDVREVLKLRQERPFLVQIMDAGGARPWNEERFSGILRDYGAAVDPAGIVLQIDITPPAGAPGMNRRTGLPLYRLLAGAGPQPVAIYSEDGIADADWPFLAPALASRTAARVGPDWAEVRSALGVRLSLDAGNGPPPLLDGKPWLGAGRGEILVPPGERRIELAAPAAKNRAEDGARVVDATCALLEAEPAPRGIRFVYESRERACLLLSQAAVEVRIDGRKAEKTLPAGERGHPLLGPPGRHEVVALTESWPEFALRVGSVALSHGIVALSGAALGLVAFLFVWARLGRKKTARPNETSSVAP